MRRTHLLLTLFALAGCSAQVSDLDDLQVDADACQNTGSTARGTDLDLKLVGLTPHVDQDMFFAVTVGEESNIEAMFVLSQLEDANLELVVPKILPEGPSDLAFWADSVPVGFDSILDMEESGAIDHQWKRPICPDGKLTFTHTTPFQDVQHAISTGAVFHFLVPPEITDDVFTNFTMWVAAIQLDDIDESKEVQTRAYFRWTPHVLASVDADGGVGSGRPVQFQVGGNALGQLRGPIDKRSHYNIEFVIDVDGDGERGNRDFVCRFEREQAPDSMDWSFQPNLDECDFPSDFDPRTFTE